MVEEFRTPIYNGFRRDEPDILRARGWAPTDYLRLLDEVKVDNKPTHRGLQFKEPCGALPRKCLFIYLATIWVWLVATGKAQQ
jgi:hypothetical protein